MTESGGETEIQFYGEPIRQPNDIRTSDYPSGGTLSFVGSTTSFGYQPLIGAGATAVVDGNGTITSINITNPGSGYRSGIQTNIFVGVTTDWPPQREVEIVGTAQASNGQITGVTVTNPGVGYTTPLYVVIDEPLSYYNVPLVYSSASVPGVGTEGTVDIVVGQGSSVIDFKINKPGYDYGQGEILTVAVGGTTGIPTTGSTFQEFQIPVERTESDSFSGWHLGKLVDLDKIEQLFDGKRKTFPLRLLNEPVTIKAGEGSNVDIDAVILVFINDILQRPSEAYRVSNGSALTFSEAPNGPVDGEPGLTGDTCKILFYQGSGDVDVIKREVPCNIEIGDNLTIHRTKHYCPNPAAVTQDPRLVKDIISVDIVETVPYQGPGISGDPTCLRVVEWCKQTEDIFLDGKIESKSRCELEARVYPTARAIQKVGTGSSVIYVDSVKLGFDDLKEDKTPIEERLKIKVVDQTQEPAVVEHNQATSYSGDFGRVVGYGLADFGGTQEITVDLYIPQGSYMRDAVRLGAAATSISGLSTGDFFVISDSNVGFANTTNISVGINTSEVIGVGTQFIDNVYQVRDTSIVNADIPGIGITSVLRIGTNMREEGGITFASQNVLFDDAGIGFGSAPRTTNLSTVGFVTGSYLGSYSWGKINLGDRQTPRDFSYNVTDRMNAPIISRFRALKDNNYL